MSMWNANNAMQSVQTYNIDTRTMYVYSAYSLHRVTIAMCSVELQFSNIFVYHSCLSHVVSSQETHHNPRQSQSEFEMMLNNQFVAGALTCFMIIMHIRNDIIIIIMLVAKVHKQEPQNILFIQSSLYCMGSLLASIHAALSLFNFCMNS